jgi:hypothetical protein
MTLPRPQFLLTCLLLGFLLLTTYSLGADALILMSRRQAPPATEPSTQPTTTDFSIPSPEEQTRLLSLGAILSHQNRESYTELKINTISPAQQRVELKEWWDVIDEQTARNTLGWLAYTGHSQQFHSSRRYMLSATQDSEQQYQEKKALLSEQFLLGDKTRQLYLTDFVWKHRHDLRDKDIAAWDWGRLVNVARWSYTAGYITEAEAWYYIKYANHQARTRFDSWEDFSQNYILGRAFWSHTDNQAENQAAITWLLTNPNSPWKNTPWK